MGGEWGWLRCWKEPSLSPAFITDFWARHDTLFHPNALPELAAVRLKWAEVEREQIEFVNGVTNESLGRILPLSHHTNQSGVPDATCGEPFHEPSGLSGTDDTAAWR